jgi:hypothetical protein
MEGMSNVSRSAVAMAMLWLALAKAGRGGPSQLMVAATSLAQA